MLVPWSWTSGLQNCENWVSVAYKTPSLVFSSSSWDRQTLSLASPHHTVLALGTLQSYPLSQMKLARPCSYNSPRSSWFQAEGEPIPGTLCTPPAQQVPPHTQEALEVTRNLTGLLRVSTLVGLSWMVKPWSRGSPQDATAPLSPRPALLNWPHAHVFLVALMGSCTWVERNHPDKPILCRPLSDSHLTPHPEQCKSRWPKGAHSPGSLNG